MAAEMGLSVDTPVVVGSSDAVNSSLGAGAVAIPQATLMVGTSGALRVISPRPVLDPKSAALPRHR
jgi:gluconokinase